MNTSENLDRRVKATNQQLTVKENTPPKFLAPYPKGGLKGLIKKILRIHGATWRGDVGLPANRDEAIKSSLFTEQIVFYSKGEFTGGTPRYPEQSVKNALVEMAKDDVVGKIELNNAEDFDRDCDKPRFKWYLKE
ncbi:MAG TPA: hypothetical protein P5205_18070 [Candidatus Paceibacterota bacterium]|nr:hypothetical protein [Verrucomicrobiota bacterium]HSA12270.1 hypothetical protein [Candidatus Paceibacterota bacterium]